MVGNTFWSTGYGDQYGEIARRMNNASREDLELFVKLLREDNMKLMEAHQKAFFKDSADLFNDQFKNVQENWFGPNSMWFDDCTLTLNQIHAVMRESRARTAELLLRGAGEVKLYIQCGHPRFRTVITWDGAKPSDENVWNPTPAPGTPVHVWVYTPFNSAYGDPEALKVAFMEEHRTASARLEEVREPPAGPEGAELLSQLVEFLPAAKTIFKKARINQTDMGDEVPMAAVEPTWLAEFQEPPPDPPSHSPSMLRLPPVDVLPRVRSGIELSFRSKEKPRFLVHAVDGAKSAAYSRRLDVTVAPIEAMAPEIPAPEPALALDRPLRWTTANGAKADLLDDLQANILKSHVRNEARVHLLTLPDDPQEGKALLRALVPFVKTTRAQLEQDHGDHWKPYVGIGLSRAGYDQLGEEHPTDEAFVQGMHDRGAWLGDPARERWEQEYQRSLHAIVIVAGADATTVRRTSDEITALAGTAIVRTEIGRKLGVGLEHFGYLDGRSQPLFLEEDALSEGRGGGGAGHWSPALALDRVLVPDTGEGAGHFGTYLVYRKLEQNVRRFRQYELEVARDLHLLPGDAGARLVGRFRDGTPLALQSAPGMVSPVANDFSYAGDAEGMKCPFASHVRTANPRSPAGQAHLMARRGIPYGNRALDLSDEPEAGVGMLFMALNANISEQFEFVQRQANRPRSFDPIVGQGALRPNTIGLPNTWAGDPNTDRTEVPAPTADEAFVKMLGGEYFFLPSLHFLRSL